MVNQPKIRVLLVDDQPVVLSGLSAFLFAYPDLELVGEARSGDEALQLCNQNQPDVILMDLVMPGISGVEATRTIKKRYPSIQIIALTSYPEEQLVHDALRAGAISYLLKNVSAKEIADAIRVAYQGQSTLSPEATQALVHAATAPPQIGHDLTPRERDVLALIAKGLNNSKIADQLNISLSTVQFHVSSILSKLGVSNRVEVAILAVKHNLVK